MSVRGSTDQLIVQDNTVEIQLIRAEMNQIQEQLAYQNGILKEFNDLVTKKKRFRTDPCPIITTLKHEFKVEFMEEVMRLLTSSEDQIKSLKDSTDQTNYRLNEATLDLKRQTESNYARLNLLQDQADNLREASGRNGDDIFYIKDSLILKAEKKDLESLERRVDTYTPYEAFVVLEDTVRQLAYKSDINQINEELENINDQLALLPTAEQIVQAQEKIVFDLKATIDAKLDADAYENSVFSIKQKQDNFENRIDSLTFKTSRDKDTLNKLVMDISLSLNSKP